MKLLKKIMLLSLVSLLTACSIFNDSSQYDVKKLNSSLKPPKLKQELFVPVEVISPDLFSITKEQEEHFLEFYNDSKNKKFPRHKRIVEYISDFYLGFTYYGKTYTASETLEKKQGNCLSLVLMSSALAEVVGLKYKYRKVHSKPVFERFNNVMTVGGHVNFTLLNQLKGESGQLLFPAAITIDYFPSADSVSGESLSKQTIVAMFFQNKAAEAMIDEQLDLAFSYAYLAFKEDPFDPETLNIISVLYSKKGAIEESQKLYAYMFENKLLSLSAVDNYSNLLRKVGKIEQANRLVSEYEGLADENPYAWLNKGSVFLAKNELRLAEKYTLRSIAKAPYLHEAQFQLAKIYWQQSRYSKAVDALQQAKELAYRPSDEYRYQAKIKSLQYQISSG